MKKTNEIVSIIIPSIDNTQYLRGALTSIIRNGVGEGLFHIYVVNNGGAPNSLDWIEDSPYITKIQIDHNSGWEGAITAGLKASKGEFVCFFNDDAYIPPSSRLWLQMLLQHFKDPKVAAVGPASNVVLGYQNIFVDVPFHTYEAKFLIGYCVIVRRKYFEEIGAMDLTLPGGDDFDWSIRFRDKGYKLIGDREVFVFHHGFKTGERINGDASKPNGWNSFEYTERVDVALIRKHGFKKWWETKKGAWELPQTTSSLGDEDSEGNIIRKLVDKKGKILDVGCGGNKTLPEAIGIDMVPNEEDITTLIPGTKSQANVVADINNPLPFEKGSIDTIIARHILEHLIDSVTVLTGWRELLKPDGKLVIAVPNQDLLSSIPMSIEHVHAFNPGSLKGLLESLGFKVLQQFDSENKISFITVATLK